jgi:hypothetical protein
MQAADAFLITLPDMPDAEIAALESQLGELEGVDAASVEERRGPPVTPGALILLKVSAEALRDTAHIVRVLDMARDLLDGQGIVNATVTLPDGTVVALTGPMPGDAVEDAVKAALDAAREGTSEHDYEVAVSFADEDRDYVSRVVAALKRRRMRVFYDADHEASLFGRDLAEVFDDVFRHRSRYVVIFVSQHYVRKQWTRYELRSVLARAIQERQGYVLPARFDDSDVPGVPPTVRHVDCRTTTPEALADIICQKLGR